MKNFIFSLFTSFSTTLLQASSLYFTSGVVTNYNNVALSIQGPTNQTCQVERLNRTNLTWDAMGTVTLNASGTATFNTTLFEGIYGFYRVKTTNNASYSTNAYGAVAGTLYPGYSLIGNAFDAQDVSALIPQPFDGTSVYTWDNAITNWNITTSDSGVWYPSMQIGAEEGFIVDNITTNTMRFLVSGLFNTNQISKSVPKDLSLLCSPLYKPIITGSYTVDSLNTNRLGGLSTLPVQATGFDPHCKISRIIDS